MADRGLTIAEFNLIKHLDQAVREQDKRIKALEVDMWERRAKVQKRQKLLKKGKRK